MHALQAQSSNAYVVFLFFFSHPLPAYNSKAARTANALLEWTTFREINEQLTACKSLFKEGAQLAAYKCLVGMDDLHAAGADELLQLRLLGCMFKA
eukprot:scaffold265457_cov19-Tisochrysis_lutea.AAC.1